MAVSTLARPSSKTALLGTIGMIGSPFLLLSFLAEGEAIQSRTGELFGFIFIASSLLSVIGLRLLGATGKGVAGRTLSWVHIAVLSLASLWSAVMSVSPGVGQGTPLFSITDACWPLSMLMMLVSGVTIAIRGGLTGWRRWVPMLCGLALPLAFASMPVIGKAGSGMLFGSYAAVMWMALGYGVRTEPAGQAELRPRPLP